MNFKEKKYENFNQKIIRKLQKKNKETENEFNSKNEETTIKRYFISGKRK